MVMIVGITGGPHACADVNRETGMRGAYSVIIDHSRTCRFPAWYTFVLLLPHRCWLPCWWFLLLPRRFWCSLLTGEVHEGCLCRGRVVHCLLVVRPSGCFLGNLLDVGRIVSDIDCGDETIPETWKGKR